MQPLHLMSNIHSFTLGVLINHHYKYSNMKHAIISCILTALLGITWTGCAVDWEQPPSEFPERSEGLRPIYYQGTGDIRALPPQPIERLGKIYYKSPFIFMNERYKGIHIVDNSNPETPQKVAFIQIPGNQDISIKGNYLYADNFTDLVCLDISDYNNPTEVSRVPDLYTDGGGQFPEEYVGYFECVDESLGLVIGWESAMLDNPKCWR